MSSHVIKNVTQPWFAYMKAGTKTGIEAVNKGNYTDIKEGDTIKFFPKKGPFKAGGAAGSFSSNDSRPFKATVTSVHHHKTLENLFRAHTLKETLPGICDMKSAIKYYIPIFGKENIKKYGLLEIKIQV